MREFFEPKETVTSDVVNTISQGTQVEGNIVTNGECQINGIVKGNIISKSKVIIGKPGLVEGNITCQNIVIEGAINAESLNVSELVLLKATANFKGNILTNKIAIESGAEFSGNCKMQNHKTTPDVAPGISTKPIEKEKGKKD